MGLQSLSWSLLIFGLIALSHSSMAAQWLGDGSPQISSNGNQLTYTNASKTGNVYNALWEDGDGVSSGQHYWQLQITKLDERSLFVGVTDKSKFKRGYWIQGLFYGGNLADGSSLLVGNFGPWIKSGDVVGIFVSFEQGNIKVYFDVNGNSLGLAYDVSSSILNGVYPVVQFGGEGSLRITKVAGQPRSLTRFIKTGLEDTWVLMPEEFKVNGSVKMPPTDLPNTQGITVYIEQGDGIGKYIIVFDVVNSIGGGLEYKDGKWISGRLWSSLVGVTPEVEVFEDYMGRLATNPTRIELVSNGSYLVWENTNENMYSKWKRSPGPGGVTKNPFQ